MKQVVQWAPLTRIYLLRSLWPAMTTLLATCLNADFRFRVRFLSDFDEMAVGLYGGKVVGIEVLGGPQAGQEDVFEADAAFLDFDLEAGELLEHFLAEGGDAFDERADDFAGVLAVVDGDEAIDAFGAEGIGAGEEFDAASRTGGSP